MQKKKKDIVANTIFSQNHGGEDVSAFLPCIECSPEFGGIFQLKYYFSPMLFNGHQFYVNCGYLWAALVATPHE